MKARHIDVVEVAKLIKRRLRNLYPDTKFSVRTDRFAGGSSVDISYVDGPTQSEVEGVANSYKSARFDGMIDMGWSVTHWLMPDGTAVVAKDRGSTGSRGVHEPTETKKPHPEAELVSFGSNMFVSVSREFSPDYMERVAEFVRGKHGLDAPIELFVHSGKNATAYVRHNDNPDVERDVVDAIIQTAYANSSADDELEYKLSRW